MFAGETPQEWRVIREACAQVGVPVACSDHFSRGGAGAEELARLVVETTARPAAGPLHLTYPDTLPLLESFRRVRRGSWFSRPP